MQDKFQAGPGTYTRGGYIYASVVGMQQVVTNDGDCGGAEMQVLCGARTPVVPEPGSVVIAKVFERTDKQSSDQITSHQITSVHSIGSVTRQR